MVVMFIMDDLHVLQLIAVAALFLAAKSEEMPCPLNNVVRASCEILHKQDINFLSYLLPVVSILWTDFIISCQMYLTYFLFVW